MDGSIFIPSQEVRKEVGRGGGSPFQKSFWELFNAPEEYDRRKSSLSENLNPIIQTSLPDRENLYAEITYTDITTSKSSRPSNIWQESNLEVIQSVDNKTFTVVGKKEDYEKLNSIINRADFSVAKGNAIAGQEAPTTKRKNTDREVYAVSAIRDKNKGMKNRLDRQLAERVNLGATGEHECIIELYQDRRLNAYDGLYRKLNGVISEDKLFKRNEHALKDGLSYKALLTNDDIQMLLQDDEYNFIRLIRISPEYRTSRSVSNIDSSSWTLGSVQTNETVGIIDSGISSPIFNSLKFNSERFAGKFTVADKEHGTEVASRVLFGDAIRGIVNGDQPTLSPIAKYLDVQVAFSAEDGSGETVCDDDQLLKAVDEVTDRYPDIKIYNLSIADNRGLDERFPGKLTTRLDKIAREKDVLFICVTGNHKIANSVEYEDIFTQHKNSSLLLPPGDTMANLTVGSYAEVSDSEAAAEKGYPSPFTRKALLRDCIRKPDLVESGGNYLSLDTITRSGGDPVRASTVSRDKYGVIVLGPDGLQRTQGTSISAPMVTHKATRILDAIKKTDILDRLPCEGNIANLVKALTVHSTAFSDELNIREDDIKQALGFGIPSVDKLLEQSDDKVTILYCDKLDGTTKKHKLNFALPDFAVTGDIKFTFTLAYSPPVSQSYAKYSMIDATGSVRVPYGDPDDIKHQYIKSTGKRSFTVQGSGIHHFSKRQQNGLRNNIVEVLVQMYLFEEYEQKYANRMEEVEQPYAIALTIEDMSASGRLKQELLLNSQIESLVQVGVTVS